MFSLHTFKCLIEETSSPGVRKSLNFKQLASFQLPIPSLAEQQKIADCLSSLDELIEASHKKVETLQQHKKGLMQKLFSQEVRFKDNNGKDYPPWKEKKLGKMCKITTGKLNANAMVKNGLYRFYTCAKEYFFIDEYVFDTEALLISGNGANVGYIHYYKGKFNAYQRTYVLTQFIQNVFYVKYYLDVFLTKRISLEKKAGNTPYIVLSSLSDMPIILPSLPEQQKIADCLSSLDELIEACEKKVAVLKQHKKGLMQKLFV